MSACYGYGLWVIHTTTKKEYQHLSRREAITLRRQGITLTETIHEPILIYLSDLPKNVLEIFQYPYVITNREKVGSFSAFKELYLFYEISRILVRKK